MPLRSVSLQLYSVRDALERDIPGTIARVADIGLRQVEASYKVLSRGPELLDAIRANGLTAPTMTSPLLDVDRDAVFATANELGAGTVVETFLPEPLWTSADDVRRIADELNAAAEKAAGYGLRVGYHNHWWELEQEFEGMTALDLLASELRPEVVFEIDAYWVAVGGVDPVEFIARHVDRVRFLHLKDGPVSLDKLAQKPAGQGSMPVLDVIEAAKDLEVGVIEFDEYDGDVFDAIAQSFAYLDARVAA
jgi:sugar phosphate isomerase/epimerase